MLGEFFASGEVSAYLVGGVVRDALLSRDSEDVDVAVCGDTRTVGADLARKLGGRCFLLDKSRDVLRVVVPETAGGSVIDLNPIHEGIRGDLSGRDFTLDAMAVSVLEAGAESDRVELIDPHDGASDLREGVIRAVCPSVFADDPARLMRAPRLAAQLGFTISEETADSIRRHARLVSDVAPERVRDEFLKLMAQPRAASSLRQLDDLGLLCTVIPELAETKGVTQPKEHYWDVFDHSIETVGQVERLLLMPLDDSDCAVRRAPRFESIDAYFSQEVSDGHSRLTLLKLGGLLHDIAKPATKTIEVTGRVRFLGHHRVGAEMSSQILGRLRISRRGIDLVRRLVEHHLRPSQMAQIGELPSSRAMYRYYRDVGDAAIDTLYLNIADYLAARGPHLSEPEWAEHCRVIGHILGDGSARRAPRGLPKLIDGHDIMQTFSLSPGPPIGFFLELVREAQASGEIASRDEALELVNSKLRSGGKGA